MTKTLTIEVVYESREECEFLLSKFSLHHAERNGTMKKETGNAILKADISKTRPFIEPRIEEINGNKCLVFPSAMNF